ncbi:MAG: hypothetical protein U0K60_11175 [Parafannyhessea umbonata]|nr:hypothetical protein [Parafannyhessea umbonata]
MIINIEPGTISGLTEFEVYAFRKLLSVYQAHSFKNAEKDKYYEGKISLNSVNLGIALPKGMQGLEIGCSWGAKCVDVLAARSMFDGFVGVNGEDVEALDRLVADNRLLYAYMSACRDELKYGCTFATLSADPEIGCKIRFHSPKTAAAVWDGDKGRIAYGMAIIDTAPDNNDTIWTPSLINLYLDYAVLVFERVGSRWSFTRYPHRMGRPLMEALIWNATSTKPFGRSRIKEPIRRLIQGYVRTIANATIGLEFATAPQKYLLGVTDDQYDTITGTKFQQYVGNILAATTNPDTGEKPTFGQLAQGNISPHVEMIRVLATQFSAATGLTVTDTGVVSEANPSSSDAILAQSQTLVAMAEQLNAGNGDALRTIALMALAIMDGTTMEALTDDQKDIIAHFKNPAMPSVAVTADAAIKIASARSGFAGTDTFLEMIGFDQADIRRIRAQERLQRGTEVLSELNLA